MKPIYYVTGFRNARPGEPQVKIVEERVNGFAVNEYKAYDRVGDRLALFPIRRVIPSEIPLEKKEISIYETRRGY